MHIPGWFLAACGSATLASCGQPLGEYELETIQLTAEAPLPEGVRAPIYGRYLKVELSSETSLTAIADTIDGVYAHADFCPFSDPYSLTTFGPFSSDNVDLQVPSFAEPLQRGPDGKFHYNVFIVPKHPMPNVTYSKAARERETYDIGSNGRDVCLMIDAPGYDIIKSKSGLIRIPYEQIAASLSSGL
ncbi:hypothetical protein GRI44_02405 [Altererythrobacter confluentis]|uniref:Uncharacterized protein n=1 Tax=Allopontixanthobacter confluentis TaxID=1849021 RepID=A0A6L7GDN9_9SPHN|nr:hypothetical protein [Allopontixanthobacter confluentis]MXP13605.1 hypothetical protein [Allopontixanthobacter confluentis]